MVEHPTGVEDTSKREVILRAHILGMQPPMEAFRLSRTPSDSYIFECRVRTDRLKTSVRDRRRRHKAPTRTTPHKCKPSCEPPWASFHTLRSSCWPVLEMALCEMFR